MNFFLILISAYREHLKRRHYIENRRPSTSSRREQERNRRRILSAKRAQFVEQQLTQQTRLNKHFLFSLFFFI